MLVGSRRQQQPAPGKGRDDALDRDLSPTGPAGASLATLSPWAQPPKCDRRQSASGAQPRQCDKDRKQGPVSCSTSLKFLSAGIPVYRFGFQRRLDRGYRLRAPEAGLVAPQQLKGVWRGRVEDERGRWGHAASLRFSSSLIEPDVPISGIRLSD